MSSKNESAVIEGIVNKLPTNVKWFKKRCRYLMECNARFVEFIIHNWEYITGKHKIHKSCNDEANLWAVFTELEFACLVLLNDKLNVSFVPEKSTSTPDFRIYTDDGYEFYTEVKRFSTTDRERRLQTTLKEIDESIRCIPSSLSVSVSFYGLSFDGLEWNESLDLLELDRDAIIEYITKRIRVLDNTLSVDGGQEESFSAPSGTNIDLFITKPHGKIDNNITSINCGSYPILYTQNEHLNIVDVVICKINQLVDGKANTFFIRAENDSYETSDLQVAIDILTSNNNSDGKILESKLNEKGIAVEEFKHNLSKLSALLFRNNWGNTESRTFFWINPNPAYKLPDWICEHLRKMII